VTNPANGTLTVNPTTGAFTYTPNASFNGTDSFTFKANDGTADSNVATVSLTITAVNDVPVAQGQAVSTDEDAPVGGQLAATDVDSPALTFAVVANPANGTLTVNPATGAFTYTPNANFAGTDSFTFKANDGSADSNVATVSITVRPLNDVPVAAGQSVTTAEDTPVGGMVTATDVESAALTYAVVTGPAHGTLTLNPATGAFTYTPNANFHGSDSFTFRASDGTANSNTATVSLTVAPVNDTPVAQGQAVSTDEDASVGGQLAATDVDSPVLTFAVVCGPANGALTVNPNGTFTYTPNANFHGTDSFTFKANDGAADSNVATVSITVRSVNDVPVAAGQSVTTDEDTSIGGTVTATDVESPTPTFAVVASPANGTLTLNPTTGAFTYTPRANFNGTDRFTFRASDGTANSNTATVTVTVRPANDAPTATPAAFTVGEGSPLGGVLDREPQRVVHLHPGRRLHRAGQLHLQGERRHRRQPCRHGVGHRRRLRERRPGGEDRVRVDEGGPGGDERGAGDRRGPRRPHLRGGDRPGARHADPQPGDRAVHLHPGRRLLRPRRLHLPGERRHRDQRRRHGVDHRPAGGRRPGAAAGGVLRPRELARRHRRRDGRRGGPGRRRPAVQHRRREHRRRLHDPPDHGPDHGGEPGRARLRGGADVHPEGQGDGPGRAHRHGHGHGPPGRRGRVAAGAHRRRARRPAERDQPAGPREGRGGDPLGRRLRRPAGGRGQPAVRADGGGGLAPHRPARPPALPLRGRERRRPPRPRRRVRDRADRLPVRGLEGRPDRAPQDRPVLHRRGPGVDRDRLGLGLLTVVRRVPTPG
ncbi:tandem-95 repeat protein, partial [bacterium]|nr:tandem-95 repeat protein [bacterium]